MLIFCLLVTSNQFHELQNSPNSFSNQYTDFLNPLHQNFEVVKQENRTKKNAQRDNIIIANVSPIYLSLLYGQKTHQKEVVLPILTVKLLRVNSV